MSFIKTMISAIFRTFGRFIAYIIIGAIVYIIGSKFVFAQGQYRYINRDDSTSVSSWTNLPSSTTYITNSPIIFNKSGKTFFQLKDTVAFASGKKYDLQLNFEFEVSANSIYKNIDVVGSVATEIYNGSTLKSISSQCTTNYLQTDDLELTGTIYTAKHNILGTITCKGVEGSGYYPYFGFQAKIGGSGALANGYAKVKFISWDYHLNNDEANTQSIINNQNNNTQSIINNNNYNTQRIETSINDVNDTLNDSSVDNPSSDFSSMESLVPTNGVVSGILLLPVQLFQAVLNSIDGTCSAFSLGTLYNHNLTMPCINIQNKIGSTLYGVIDILISGLFVLAIRKKFVDIFEHFTSLKTGGNELE